MTSYVDLSEVASGQESWAGRWVDPREPLIARVAGAETRPGPSGSSVVTVPGPVVDEPGPALGPAPGFSLFPTDAPPGSIIGSADADRLRRTAAKDTMFGLAGNDIINGMAGADRMRDMPGNDICIVDNAGDVVVETANGGRDVIHAFVSHALSAHVDSLVMTGATRVNGVGNDLANRLTGNAVDNILRSAGGTDTITGGAGTDRLFAGNGHDVLNSDVGRDQLSGGSGADAFVLRHVADRDAILDFQDNIDTIRMVDFGISSIAQARVHAMQSGADVIFDLGDVVTVRSMTIGGLGYDLIFV